MIIVYIILAMIAYLIIGGFVSGLFDKDIRAVYVMFWPMFLFVSIVFAVFWLIYITVKGAAKAGQYVVKKWT